MKKRDIKIYDNSWNNISEHHTEYDVEIITNMIAQQEWQYIVKLEKEFDKLFPEYKFNYYLIEFDSNVPNDEPLINGKLIYDSDPNDPNIGMNQPKSYV
jgi:hypothetical protein